MQPLVVLGVGVFAGALILRKLRARPSRRSAAQTPCATDGLPPRTVWVMIYPIGSTGIPQFGDFFGEEWAEANRADGRASASPPE